MSVINTERDLEDLLIDMRGELSRVDLEKIAEALPTAVLIEAAVRRAQPGSNYKITTETALSDGVKFGILVRVYLAWIKVPAQRLGQLAANGLLVATNVAANYHGLFYVKDELLVDLIERFAQEYPEPYRVAPKPPSITHAVLHAVLHDEEGVCLHEGPCERYTAPKE